MLPSPRNPIFRGTVLEITNSSAELIACDDMMSGRYSAVLRLIYNKEKVNEHRGPFNFYLYLYLRGGQHAVQR